MKSKFIELRINEITPAGEIHDFTEWFCLASTWTHPYNTRDENAAAFQKWCAENERPEWNSVAPNITIGGAVLNDGWGSDMVGRIVGLTDWRNNNSVNENAFAKAIEDSLKTGKATDISISGPQGTLHIDIIPYDTISPDEDSIKMFGPFADAVRKSFENI